MSYKIMQMVLRSFTLAMTVLGFFYASESMYPTRIDNFIILGICGSYSIVTLGLLLEAGLQLSSDKVLEAAFLIGGIALGLLSAILSFTNLCTVQGYRPTDRHMVNNGVVSTLAVIIFIVDVVLLLLY